MYAVIKTGGKQYRVQPGDLIVVEKLAGEPGDEIKLDQVLMMGDDVGAPLVAKAFASAVLVETRKGEKVKIFKKIRRQGYRRTNGHRQPESVLRVVGLTGSDGKAHKWDGKADLTTKAELDARARNLAPRVEAEAKPVKAAKPAKAEAAAETKAAPKKAAAAKTETKTKAAPKKAAAKKSDEA
ncbi:50S ribosomal protein L21 [Brevundimonas aveniformis]|uniref:50S ribosomal protein L21 n=1 Tax=Brevundimonas aveniformis TaxID=370977 RepID=UPI0003F886C2|nr:50S ribosomal protein L21 [Brevundimonas aveniformis]